MFKQKRAQAEIIVTILIILLVLAAIVIVWQVVQGTVNRAGGQAQTAADCLNTQLSIGSASYIAGNIVSVVLNKGNANGAVSPSGMRLLVLDNTGAQMAGCSVDITVAQTANIPSAALGQGTIQSVACNPVLTTGKTYTVKIAPKFGTSQCDPVASYSFTA